MDTKLIGIAGTFASGKDTLASHLVSEYGYQHVSLGDVIRQELTHKGLEHTRDNLVLEANEMRRELGGGVLVEKAIERNESGLLAVSGIRALGEATMIVVNDGLMLFVDAPAKERYERLRKRGRLDDDVSYDDFVLQEQRELESSETSNQNINGVRGMAHVELVNDSSENDLFVAFRGLLAQL